MGDHPNNSSPKSNFHTILGISKSATLSDICKAYKSLVMKWHPDKNPSNKAEAEKHFSKITEAYRVLSSKKRDESAIPIFSQQQPKTPKTPKAPKVSFNKDEEVIISSPTTLQSPTKGRRSTTPASSTSSSPNTTPHSHHHSNGGGGGGDQSSYPSLSRAGTRRSGAGPTPIIYSQSTARRSKPKPIEKKLECTLEELWRGCVKKIKITRDVISETGLIVQEEEILKIGVKPGWKKGTKITFEGKGDERPGHLPADIIFVIDEKNHPVFIREGDDLELGVEVPLVQALTGCTITVPMLGGETMNLSFDKILYPGYEKIIPGQGMPKSKQEGARGDLRLKFLVEFPTELSDEQRSEVSSVLNEECS